MFTVSKKEVSIDASVGGHPRSSDKLPSVCFEWLEKAATIAEKLLRSEEFSLEFLTFAPPHGSDSRQKILLGRKLQSTIKDLKLTVCYAELGSDMACYVRKSTAASSMSTDVNINKSFLRSLFSTYDTAPTGAPGAKKKSIDGKDKDELEALWIAVLAIKTFHAATHYLLTFLNSSALHLLGVTEEGYQLTPPKKFKDTTFFDFGNLLERVCFGGVIGVSDDWSGQNLVSSDDEGFSVTTVVTSVSSVLRGEIGVLPTSRLDTTVAESADTRQHQRASTDQGSASSSGSATMSAIVGEALLRSGAPIFLPEDQWDTAKTLPIKRT